MSIHDFLQFESLPCTERGREDDWFIPAKVTPGVAEEYGTTVRDLERRRDAAIEACRADCPMKARLLCLDEGMKPLDLSHGIRGGYTELERRSMARTLHQRNRRLNSRAAARAMLKSEEGREELRPG